MMRKANGRIDAIEWRYDPYDGTVMSAIHRVEGLRAADAAPFDRPGMAVTLISTPDLEALSRCEEYKPCPDTCGFSGCAADPTICGVCRRELGCHTVPQPLACARCKAVLDAREGSLRSCLLGALADIQALRRWVGPPGSKAWDGFDEWIKAQPGRVEP